MNKVSEDWLCQDFHIWHTVTDYGIDKRAYLLNIFVELLQFELQFRVRFIFFKPGLLHILNTLILFRILMIIYFLILISNPNC